jgi:6-phosphogluconolactonase
MKENILNRGSEMLTCARSRRNFLKTSSLGALAFALSNRASSYVAGAEHAGELLMFVGSYTSGGSKGIYLYRFHLSSGELVRLSVTEAVEPSFLALSPNRRFLYAVNELEEFSGKKSGALSAFSVNQQTGELKLLNQQPSLGGAPCYVTVDKTGRFVLVANYFGGNVAVLPVLGDGSLGEATDMKQGAGSSINIERQEGPHAHCIVLDQANRFAYSCDLGTDKIMIFRFDSRRGKLTANETPWVQLKPGAGPRHLTFHPSGKHAYVINELNATLTAFATDRSSGILNEIQTAPTLPPHFTAANTSADIHISPDGRFLYCSNRGHDSIAAFKVDPRNGTLTFIAHESTGGKTPRNFAIDPTGAFLLVANQKSDNIVVFRRDLRTGRLSSTGQVAEVPSPVCLKFTSRSPDR